MPDVKMVVTVPLSMLLLEQSTVTNVGAAILLPRLQTKIQRIPCVTLLVLEMETIDAEQQATSLSTMIQQNMSLAPILPCMGHKLSRTLVLMSIKVATPRPPLDELSVAIHRQRHLEGSQSSYARLLVSDTHTLAWNIRTSVTVATPLEPEV